MTPASGSCARSFGLERITVARNISSANHVTPHTIPIGCGCLGILRLRSLLVILCQIAEMQSHKLTKKSERMQTGG